MNARKLPLSAKITGRGPGFLMEQAGREVTSSPSPFMLWLKPVIISAKPGRLIFQYTVRKEMTNPIGTLHGGVTAAIIDDAIGAAIFSLGEAYFYTTISNAIDYFAAAKENDVILAETSIVKKGRRVINAQCEIWNKDKKRLLARGCSNLIKTNIEKRT